MKRVVAYEVTAWVDDEEFTRYYYFTDRSKCLDFLYKYYARLTKLRVQRLMVETDLLELCHDEIKYNHALRTFD